MRSLLDAIRNSEFEIRFPDGYLNALQIANPTPTTDEGEVEDRLIDFFINYLDTSKQPKIVAKRYDTTESAVKAERESWSTKLAKYYS